MKKNSSKSYEECLGIAKTILRLGYAKLSAIQVPDVEALTQALFVEGDLNSGEHIVDFFKRQSIAIRELLLKGET